MAARKIALAEAKAKFSAIVDGVAHRGEHYLIERHGKPVAALVGVEDLQLLERLRSGTEQPRGAMALVGLWHDVPDTDIDAMVGAIADAREEDSGRPVELNE